MFVLAAVVGGVVGLATLGLIQLILLVQWLGFGEASELRFASIVATRPAWQIIAVPTIGGLLVGLLMQLLPGRRYHGIADVMEACALNSARMPARSGFAAALAASISLGVGAPLGREGPAVHIGASISAWVAERLGLARRQSLVLLGCGAAAAVTVSFNAPIAGVLFALEVIVGYYTLQVFAPVVIAAMVAVAVRNSWEGSQALFVLPEAASASVAELPLFALLGVLGAIAVRLQIKSVELTEGMWQKMHAPRWLQPAIAGMAIGCIAIYLPLIMSVGIEGTALALQGALQPHMLAALFTVKLLVVGLAIGSGFAGGVFGPSLYLGAMLGGFFWFTAVQLGLPLGQQSLYSVVGMAAIGSAMLGAPISTVLIVFELTHDYGITLGVMTAAAFASIVMQLGKHRSYFRWQLERRNINISSGRDISLLMTHRVEHLVSQRFTRAGPACTVGELESRLGTERQQLAMIVNDKGELLGSVTLSSLVSHAIEQGMDHPASAATQGSDYAISASTNIVAALQSMAERQLDYIPVLSNEASGGSQLLGVVLRNDLLREHYTVVKRAREEEFGVA